MNEQNKIILTDLEPEFNANSEKLAECVVSRIGLMPRKRGSTQHMFRTLIEFYERAKQATAKKDPKQAVMTVEEMAIYAKISRQTMYEYLQRWISLGIITKVSYIDPGNKVIVGYKLNGNSLDEAFTKTRTRIEKNLDTTQKYIQDLQKSLKNEKISAAMKKEPIPN